MEQQKNTSSPAPLNVQVGRMLIEKGLTIATAESCTGGLVAAKLAEIPGISAALQMGLVTYSNEAKMKLLGVKADTLENYGAVSRETCVEMCTHLAELSGCDVSISVTGIAGPSGGTPEKPVGLVYVGMVYEEETYVLKCEHHVSEKEPNVRTAIQAATVEAVFNLIISKIER